MTMGLDEESFTTAAAAFRSGNAIYLVLERLETMAVISGLAVRPEAFLPNKAQWLAAGKVGCPVAMACRQVGGQAGGRVPKDAAGYGSPDGGCAMTSSPRTSLTEARR
ncbi:hypothetical protein SAMD00023353_1200270 [Rosellinia necatrix]|uniref:Uncharacterized protein n=1 Tax=Rosellinia necatrix TaxID=77044 RepID=A0A1W2TLP8_ROSNE|nr:hypothetical protein SAMD00023353_1200270 [Rosellinia necatrix]